MKNLKTISGIALLITVTCTATLQTTFAHHSFSATYDLEKSVKIKGKLIQTNFRNPHSSVMVLAPDDQGVEQRWGIEWGGATGLQRQGVTRDTFKIGDEVEITGQPSRTPEDHRLRMVTIYRISDGFGWGQKGEDFE